MRARAFFVAFALVAVAARADDTIGKATATRKEAKGTPPTQAERELRAGTELYARERVVTSPSGDVQVVFNDESTLTVGPASDLVLDEFVYDPGSTEKALGVKLRRGVARLIGGRISKSGKAEVGTPNATIAIRGGIVLVSVTGGEGEALMTRALLGLGTMVCTAGGKVEIITVPGQMCTIGQAIEVRRATPQEIVALKAALIGKGPVDLDRKFDGALLQSKLELDCGGEAAANDPRCRADAGFAGVDPEPLGGPRLAEESIDLLETLQDPRDRLPSSSLTAEKIHDICCPDE